MADDQTRGLYNKFSVVRNDGQSARGGKHEGCEYFVLDITHDPFAKPALDAYATACAAAYPTLAEDLRARGLRLDQFVTVRGNAQVRYHPHGKEHRWSVTLPTGRSYFHRSIYSIGDAYNLDFGEMREAMQLAEAAA